MYSITIYLENGDKETIGNFTLNKVREVKLKLDSNREVYRINEIDNKGNCTEVYFKN